MQMNLIQAEDLNYRKGKILVLFYAVVRKVISIFFQMQRILVVYKKILQNMLSILKISYIVVMI